MTAARVPIAVGVILDQTAENVLLARRPDHLHLGGLWEFPGGKFKPEETVQAALARELKEELNITVLRARPLIKINHDYQEQSVRLEVWLVTDWSGTPSGMEGQEVRWAGKQALKQLAFPEADKAIITAMSLPSIYGITPDLAEYGAEFFGRFESLLRDGLRLVQFRSKQSSKSTQLETVRKLFAICNEYKCRLLLNGQADQVLLEYAHGIHLSSTELLSLDHRPLGAGYYVAASCHNARELAHASAIDADFAVLSPVLPTASHPLAIPLGWDGFADLVDTALIPVYALGGMNREDVRTAHASGGQGVAMIRALWNE